MRILMTADAVGGVWAYTIQLAQSLAESGVQVLVATMGPGPAPEQRREIAAIPGASLRVSDFKLEWMENPWPDVDRAGDWLLRLQGDFHADLVHLNGYAHGALDWKVPAVVVAHSCVLSWWESVKGAAAPAELWRVYRDRVTAGLNAADHVVAPTDFMLGCIRRFYARTSDLSVIANGRNPRLFRNARLKEPFIATAGRLWDQAKNIAALDSIARDLAWPVHVAGNANAPEGRSAVSPLKSCTSLGHLDSQSFADFLSRAAICCLPARYEPFGLCALEAALSGCALVLGDIPSLREIWDGAALFVYPEDHRTIAVTLNNLIRAPKRREELARAAHMRAQSFTAQRMAEKYLSLYRSLAARSSVSSEMRASSCVS